MSSFVDIAVIKSAKGLKGEVKVKIFVSYDLFRAAKRMRLSPPTPEFKNLTTEHIKEGADHLVLKFSEINSADEANQLKDHFLQIKSTELPKGYFAPKEIVGAEVFSKDGKLLGKVIAIEHGKAHDFFIMKAGSKKVRITAVKQVIIEVDTKENKIVVDLQKGLMDLEG